MEGFTTLGFAGAHSLADEAVARYQSDRAAGGNARFAVDQDVSSYRVGPYVNLWCSARLFRTDNNGEEEDILWNGHRASFRTDTGDVMDAEAIFTDADWQSALADGLLARMRRFTPGERAEIAPGWGDAEADSRWTDAARTLAARVEAFGIGVNGLLLEYADDALDRLPEGVNAQALRDNLGDVSYADIGRARLKVFD